MFSLTAEDVEQIRQAAELHDVGKVAIPDAILEKPARLDESEWAFIRRHTLIGERIISAAPDLREVAKLVRSTHENFDGTGYPDALAGEEIPLGARIIVVCDAFDAMTTDRPYRKAMDEAAAVENFGAARAASSTPRSSSTSATCSPRSARCSALRRQLGPQSTRHGVPTSAWPPGKRHQRSERTYAPARVARGNRGPHRTRASCCTGTRRAASHPDRRTSGSPSPARCSRRRRRRTGHIRCEPRLARLQAQEEQW